MIYQDMYPRLRNPHRDAATWSFSVGGRVSHPLILSYSDLLQMPMVEVTGALLCAGTPYDESAIEQATWYGVAVSSLLEQVTLQPDALFAVLHNATGYSTSVSLDWLNRGIVAVEQNGNPLTPEQGYPARLIIPGLYGYKSPRWIERIELSDSPRGFWESRGWAGDGVAPTIAAISGASVQRDAVTLEGFAYSGAARVSLVEISIDHGAWMPVDFVPAPPAQLIRWQANWTPPIADEYSVRVRAADDSGYIQPDSAIHSLFQPMKDTLHNTIVHVMEQPVVSSVTA